jgi:hypothetical protein
MKMIGCLFPAPWDLLVAGWRLAQSGVLWWNIVAPRGS